MSLRFKTAEEAICGLTEATLATVAWMSLKKRPQVGELSRQIIIAQGGVDFIMSQAFKPSLRVLEVISEYGGNVSEWAKAQKI